MLEEDGITTITRLLACPLTNPVFLSLGCMITLVTVRDQLDTAITFSTLSMSETAGERNSSTRKTRR